MANKIGLFVFYLIAAGMCASGLALLVLANAPPEGHALRRSKPSEPQRALLRRHAKNVVWISVTRSDGVLTSKSAGTGVILRGSGNVLTAFHVVDREPVSIASGRIAPSPKDADDKYAFDEPEEAIPMRVLRTLPNKDLALLGTTDSDRAYGGGVLLSDSNPAFGDDLHKIGIRTGITGGPYLLRGRNLVPGSGLTVNANAWHGDSGGPIFCENGLLTGIVTSAQPNGLILSGADTEELISFITSG